MHAFQAAPVAELGFAQVDTHRALRQGFPEVIFGTGKTPEQVVKIAAHFMEVHFLGGMSVDFAFGHSNAAEHRNGLFLHPIGQSALRDQTLNGPEVSASAMFVGVAMAVMVFMIVSVFVLV